MTEEVRLLRESLERLVEFASFYAIKHMSTDQFYPIIDARLALKGEPPAKREWE